MFYDSQIMNSKSLKNAWRAGNNQELTTEDVPLPKVCTRLDSWIASDYMDPCRRLSLRASSILIDGVARLYRQGLADLVQDMYKLDYQMITRKRPRDFSSEDLDDSSTSEFEQSNVGAPPGNSNSPVRLDSSDGQSGNLGGNRQFTEAAPPGHSALPVRLDSSGGKDGKSGENQISQKRRSKKSRRQISVPLESTRKKRCSRTNTEELLIGQVLIYEDMGSLVPSKIVVGTVNPKVKKNIKFQ